MSDTKRASNDWPFAATDTLRIVGGEGAWLIADDGRRILDAAGGAIVSNVGHGRRAVSEAMGGRGATGSYVVPIWRTPEREALVARLRERWLPKNLHHIHLTGSGSEGVEAAVKIALQHFSARGENQRAKILSRDLSYHGTTLAMAGLSGHYARKRGLEGFLQTFTHVPTPSPLRCPLGRYHADAASFYLESTRAIIEAEGPDTIAALVVECITGSSGGAIVPPEGYLSGIRGLCDEFGILLIVDEVMTGFGRTGAKFAVDHWKLRPDILVAGKGLASGYAGICGVYADPKVAEPIIEAGMDVMFHSFAALPSACAAADAVLTILEDENLIARAITLGARLNRRLQEQLGQYPNVAEIRGMGLLQAVEIVRDRDSLVPFDASEKVTNRIVMQGLTHGAFFYPGGTGVARDIICLGPPMVATEAEIDMMADILAMSIRETLGE